MTNKVLVFGAVVGASLLVGWPAYAASSTVPVKLCTNADTDYQLTNKSDHDISVAVGTTELVPGGLVPTSFYVVKPGETKCWLMPTVAKPGLVIKDGTTESPYLGYPAKGTKFYYGLNKITLSAAPVKQDWQQVSGPAGVTLKQITAGSNNSVWALDTAMTAWKWNGTTWDNKGCCVGGMLSATADGSVWATHPPNNNRVLRWNGTRWDENFPTGMTYITVGSALNIWALNGADQVFKWTGVTWQKMPGALRNISAASDGAVWGISSTGVVYKWIP